MKIATKEFLQQHEAFCQQRKDEIRNTPDTLEIYRNTYYVSNDGDDTNDGTTPETPWKSLNKVNESTFYPGDGVCFRRGDVFRGTVYAQHGVTYTAYGEGEKPKFYSGDKNLADPELWELFDEEHHIWLLKDLITDCGTLVFNDGEFHCRKLIPSFIQGRFVCRDNESKVFDMAEEMTQDLDLFCRVEGTYSVRWTKGKCFPVPAMNDDTPGFLYLRCDRGNPGEVFDSIEAIERRVAFRVRWHSNVTIDNLCMKYCMFGISGGSCISLHVTNCEIGWIGGNIQSYDGTDPNFVAGTRGSVTRFGNAIEIYGGCRDYRVENCYIYECYDAAITHQVTTGNWHIVMKDVLYKDNLIENSVYGIEYFLDINREGNTSYMDGIEFCGNIIRNSGYGWGQQRHNVDTPALIKGWSYVNKARNYTIHDNILDRCAYRMVHLVAKEQESCPKMYRNTYIQDIGGKIGQYGSNAVEEPENLVFDEQAEEKIATILKDEGAIVYVIPAKD